MKQVLGVLALLLSATVAAQPGWDTVGHTVLRTPDSGHETSILIRGQPRLFTGHQLITIRFVQAQQTPRIVARVYNAATDQWEVRPNLDYFFLGAPASGFGNVSGHVMEDKLYVFGGSYTLPGTSQSGPEFVNVGPVGVYDLTLDAWSYPPGFMNSANAPQSRFHHGMATIDGRLVIFGGRHHELVGGGTFGGVWVAPSIYNGGVYDPIADQWVSTPNLSVPSGVPQYNHQTPATLPGACEGVLNCDGLLIAWSGDDKWYGSGQGHLFGGMVYDPATDTRTRPPGFESLSNMPMTRTDFGYAWSGEHYAVFGGWGPRAVSSVQSEWRLADGGLYSLRNDAWLVRPTLQAGASIPDRTLPTMIWTGSHFLIWGGLSRNLATGIAVSHGDGGLYSPDSDTWHTLPNLAQQYAMGHIGTAWAWTGDAFITWGGGYRDPNMGQTFAAINGGVYHPPRVAPTVRNLGPADPGASAANPLTATVGERFKHRIVCYGTPEAALISSNLPSWLSIGFGGPGPLVAVGTGIGNGGQNGNPPGTGLPFNPWFSAEGLTADGQWIHGTPTAADAGLHSFTVHAHNGVHPDTAAYTVWIEVIIPPGPPSFTTPVPPSAAIAGELYTAPVAAAGPPPVTSIQLSGHPWLSYSNGVVSGIPPVSAGGTTQGPFTLTASNGLPPDATQLFNLTVAHAYTDTNRDRAVNVTDVQLTVNIILGLAQPQWPNQGDANWDSVVNVIDVQQVVNKILNP